MSKHTNIHKITCTSTTLSLPVAIAAAGVDGLAPLALLALLSHLRGKTANGQARPPAWLGSGRPDLT